MQAELKPHGSEGFTLCISVCRSSLLTDELPVGLQLPQVNSLHSTPWGKTVSFRCMNELKSVGFPVCAWILISTFGKKHTSNKCLLSLQTELHAHLHVHSVFLMNSKFFSRIDLFKKLHFWDEVFMPRDDDVLKPFSP